jgi:ABC-type dipeptide/oligopeptide/nickel transport system permease component
VAGISTGALGGSVIVETVYNWPGVGNLVDSIMNAISRDDGLYILAVLFVIEPAVDSLRRADPRFG